MSIDARDISEAISAMEGASIFMEQNCEAGSGRIDHMIRLKDAARCLKFGIQGVKIEVAPPKEAEVEQ
jgi:hypothetical protein